MASADATRRRILEAAAAEFAQHGIAGARVDRVAAASGASKPMLYVYFGSKEHLFDAVFEDRVLTNARRVAFTVDDLPGYAVRLYDDYLADPALLRLVLWKRLERDATGYLFGGLEAVDEAHLGEIRDAQHRGTLRPDLAAEDVWSLLIAIAATWAQGSVTAVARAQDPEDDHRRRRTALRSAVTAAFAPGRSDA